jgi:DNA repair protein RadA/Sms
MAKAAKSSFVCQSCGAVASRWAGKCTSCGDWNTIVEEAGTAAPPGSGIVGATKGKALRLETLAGAPEEAPRFLTGMPELDRVTGGGIVPGSVLLIAGEPGIGKSTLLLQLAAALGRGGRRAIYFSGEEASAQVRLRAARLGLADAPVALAAETSLTNILATLASEKRADLVVVDSIQTLWSDALEAAPGSVSQVRAATQSLVRYAKTAGCALLLVGHVTKDGQIAGPKAIEHVVDTVLSFEGDRGHSYRILRATKNRFGATDEIGVFEMVGSGLREVANPSELFLGERDADAPGTAVFAGMEGTRPILVEIQALVAPSGLGQPRRAVVGWEQSRLAMLIAVLEARMRRVVLAPRCLSQRCGRAAHRGAGRRSRGGGCADFLADRGDPALGRSPFRRDRALGRNPAGFGRCGPAARSGETGFRERGAACGRGRYR